MPRSVSVTYKVSATADALAGVAAVKLRKDAAMRDMFGEETDGSRAGTPMETPKKSGVGMSVKKATGPVGSLKVRELDDDVIGSLDLGIDEIEI